MTEIYQEIQEFEEEIRKGNGYKIIKKFNNHLAEIADRL